LTVPATSSIDVGVDAVLVEQIDPVGAQASQRVVDAGADRLGAAVGSGRHARGELEAELGRDRDLLPHSLECLAQDLFVVERPVDLRGVEEGDPALDGRADQGDRVLALRDRREALAHAHATEPERRHLQVRSEHA